jgi:hypothetical protein
VAAQAATLAIFELALAIAALTPFGAIIYGSAAQHFAAAALFGSIAVATGLAGRAVAGNSFQREPAGATGGARSTSSTTSTSKPAPVDINRNNQQPSINVNVNIRRDEGSIVDAFVENHRNNGAVRQLILSEVRG